jgi:hypothetical protein
MLVAAGIVTFTSVVGCDEPSGPPDPPRVVEPTPQPVAQAASEPKVARRVAVAERFELELPAGWDARPGVDGRSTELRGPSTSGIPDDPLAQWASVSVRDPYKAPTLDLALAELRNADQRDDALEVQISQTDNGWLVERLESNVIEVEFEGTRENRTFIKATYFVYFANPDDTFETVEVSFLETTESIFLRDRDALRGLVRSITRPSTPS